MPNAILSGQRRLVNRPCQTEIEFMLEWFAQTKHNVKCPPSFLPSLR
jgi:hypothetical protein